MRASERFAAERVTSSLRGGRKEAEAGRGSLQESGARGSGRRWRRGQVPDERVGVIRADVTLTGACALARKERVLEGDWWQLGFKCTACIFAPSQERNKNRLLFF